DAEDGVTLHGHRNVEVQRAEGFDVDVVVVADKGDEAGHLFALDVAGENLVHSRETRLRESSFAHLELPAVVFVAYAYYLHGRLRGLWSHWARPSRWRWGRRSRAR